MYIPKQFEQPDIEIMHQLIRNQPLATLVTLSSDGINANHIPLHLTDTPAPFGTLQGHVARSNPVWTDVNTDLEVLTIFNGADAYISPSLYATKQVTSKVVPTWNYTAVHAYGFLRVIDDTAWIRTQLEALTNHNEAGFEKPWALSDAPEDFTKKLIKSIVGIEIVITRLFGKWKVSQNQPLKNQISIVQGLNACGQKQSSAMAELVRAEIKTGS
jgi:transcriptional regulator